MKKTNKTLHRTGIPLRSFPASELGVFDDCAAISGIVTTMSASPEGTGPACPAIGS